MKWRFWLSQNLAQPLSCASIEPLLSLYSDGMASPGEVRLVESHLNSCDDCRRALDWMQATHFVISKRPAALPPPDLRLRIAQAIAQSENSARPTRPIQRPFVLWPAFLTSAAVATFAAFGIWVGNSHTIPKPTILERPVPVAESPVPVPHSNGLAMSAHSVDARSVRRSHVALVPPRVTASAFVSKVHHSATARVASLPPKDVRATESVPEKAVMRPTPEPVLVNDARSAVKPTDKLHTLLPATPKRFVVAAIPKTLVGNKSEDAAVSSSPELASPSPQPVEVVHPAVTQVAVVVPAVTHPAHEDVLSNVRASLVALKSEAFTRKLYRNSVAHVQTIPYNSTGGLPAIISTNWTPGLYDKSESQRGKTGTEQN